MFRIERTVALKYLVDMPAAVQFAAKVAAHLNGRYQLGVKWGVGMYGSSQLHFFYDVPSLDSNAQLNAKTMQDKDYLELLAEYKHLWVEGSARDTAITLIG